MSSPLFQVRQLVSGQENTDGPGLARLTSDEATAVKGLDHLMDGLRGGLKVTLHVDLGGWDTVDLRVVVNECEILTLFRGIVGSN